ncbi:putative DNA binding domain-containing protein [Candidatus Poribacteria bacterium]|nr:putative DNA binding domain-containing protein [Candidatus Poribacteria bacterium]
MTPSELHEIISRGEDSKTQLKRQFNSIDALATEIAAMLNSEGGLLIVGVSDSGEVCGVANIRQLNQWISNACSQKIEPPVSVTTENLGIDDKLVVVINVPLGTDKPYAVNKTAFWVKVGADKRRATREELRRLMQASGTLYADEMPLAHTSWDELDLLRFRDFYKQQYNQEIDQLNAFTERSLSNLKLLKSPHLTLAGLRPQLMVKAVAFIGNRLEGTEYLDSEDIGSTLAEQFKGTMGFLKRNLRKQQNGQNFNFPGILEVPEIALEEAVVNALVHRDYLISSSIRVFIFDNCIEIISPGKLPNTATVESIRAGIQIVRNPVLISFVPKIGIPYRGLGSGVPRMIEECRKADLPEPKFIEDKVAETFTVVFDRRSNTR